MTMPTEWALECIDPLGRGWRAWDRDVELCAPSFRYKMAKPDAPKNQHDFDAVAPCLDAPSAQWLRQVLAAVEPSHRWLDVLAAS